MRGNRILIPLLLSALMMNLPSYGQDYCSGEELAPKQELRVPLTDLTGLAVQGPYRFVTVRGLSGFQPTSLKTKVSVSTNIHNSEQGSIRLWMSPLEDLNVYTNVAEGSYHTFSLLGDAFPIRNMNDMHFGIHYNAIGYPRLIGRFHNATFWSTMDHGEGPFVYAENLPLHKGCWYMITVTWDKPGRVTKMYVNGHEMGNNYNAANFQAADETLYLGNPMMILRNLVIQDRVLSREQVREIYLDQKIENAAETDAQIKPLVYPVEKPPLDLERDDSWKQVYSCDFMDKEDLEGWTFQTGDLYRDQFTVEIRDEGLFWQTPDIIAKESRSYLWCPEKFEGDIWIEYDFKLQSPRGLALFILYAGGIQAEDVIEEQGLLTTGSMGTMLSRYRNYHWEYMRRVEAMRSDVETQYLYKNPWGKTLYTGCIDRFEQDKWYRFRMLKVGPRIYGSIDGRTVFDIEDTAYDNNGPVFNSGRLVLREMYSTTMLYKNFVVYQKENF